MSDEEQLQRAEAQKLAIELYAEELGVDVEEAFILWCSSGRAEEWANEWDKGR